MDDSRSVKRARIGQSHEAGTEKKDKIRLHEVCAGYDGKEVLHKINFEIEPGKITVLAGPNGCGKSTLLKTILGITPKSSGEIWVEGRPVEQYSPAELAQRIAYLPQNRNVPEISVMRMVLHGRFPYLKYPRRYREQDVEIAKNALRQLEMEKYADESVGKLSGGMQQKVYIAMALAQDTPVIMMDEPTSFLDISYQIKLMEIVRKLAQRGKAVVMILHDLSMAFRIADSMIVLSQGHMVKTGSPEEIFQSGVVDHVFDLKLKRIDTEEGWHYYY